MNVSLAVSLDVNIEICLVLGVAHNTKKHDLPIGNTHEPHVLVTFDKFQKKL